eukprot:4040962-Ditylum_brightwellii.AAC.1
MVKEYLGLENPFKGMVAGSEVIFVYGLTSLAQARKTNEIMWKNCGHELMKKIQKLAKDSPSDYQHKLLVLESECGFTAGREKSKQKI